MTPHRLHVTALVSRSLAGLLALVLVAAPAAAQSLGEVARREQVRRETAQKGKVYTNDSLPDTPPAPATPVRRSGPPPQAFRDGAAAADTDVVADGGAPAEPGGAPQAASEPAAPDASTPESSKADAKKHEEQWRERITKARAALSRDESFAEALQSRINALSTDFVNRDDPSQRAVIGADRDKALAELDRVKRDIQNHQKAIAAIREEARREGVPPGWVR